MIPPTKMKRSGFYAYLVSDNLVGNFFRKTLLKQARDKITAGCGRAMVPRYRVMRQQT
jgi:hypothetical protein